MEIIEPEYAVTLAARVDSHLFDFLEIRISIKREMVHCDGGTLVFSLKSTEDVFRDFFYRLEEVRNPDIHIKIRNLIEVSGEVGLLEAPSGGDPAERF